MGNTFGRVIPASHASDNDAAKIALSLYWTCRTGNHHVAGNLISRGADVNVRHPDSGEGALHAATAHGHFKVIKVLLSNKANPNLRSAAPHDETPLHCAIKTAQNPRCTQWDRSRALQCAKLLLQERNIKVDVKDYCGLTPVHIAVQCELWDFTECLIAAGANIDILIDGETVREILLRSKPSLLSLASTKIEPQISIRTKLFEYLKSGKEDKFIANIFNDSSITTDILQRFIQRASVNGYNKIVKHLIDLGADPYCSGNNSQTPAIVLAAKQGFHETLKVLLESSTPKHAVVDHPLWRRTALHHAAISAADATMETKGGSRNLVACVSLLLKHSRAHHLDINARDFRGNTALQYAAKTYHREIIQLLLSYDASIFFQNDQNIPVFLNIHTKDLEYYFDSLISIKGYTKSDRCHSLTFNYNFLQKPVEPLKQVRKLSLVQNKTNNSDDEDDEDYMRAKQSNTLEMEPLLLLSRSTVHRPLLTHPIVTSFLHLKWQRVKLFFYINFILYMLFTIFLSLHIHFLISAHNIPLNETSETNSTTQNLYKYDTISSHNIIRWLAALFLTWPLCREILELLMSIRRYFRNIENIMETSLLILAIILLFIETDYYSRQIMSAIAILLTYTDLVFLIGRHPRFSTYITMFTRVSRNFLGLFFLFSFLIFAFAFSFHIIFVNCLDNDICESRFFSHLGSSIFKTIIMLTGELEAESIKFDLFGYFMFTGFVVFISICLLNLLTGLAVSDITAIREEAEVDSWRAKVKLYAKIESILLGYSIEGLNKENCFIRRLQTVASRMFSAKIRLLGHLLPENCLEVYLNVDNRMEPDVTARSWRDKFIPKSCIQGQFSSRNQEWDAIISEAQAIVGSGGVGGTNVVGADTQRIIDRLDALEAKLTSILELIQLNKD